MRAAPQTHHIFSHTPCKTAVMLLNIDTVASRCAQVYSVPSLADIDLMQDSRTSAENLFCSSNCTNSSSPLLPDGSSTSGTGTPWLAPVCHSLLHEAKASIGLHEGDCNMLYILFEQPTPIATISFTNYSKTPLRGVKKVSILFDDALLYMGNIPPAWVRIRMLVPDSSCAPPDLTLLVCLPSDCALPV